MQHHRGRQDAPVGVLLKNARAVAHGQVCHRQCAQLQITVKEGHALQHVLQLIAVGTGVHIDRTAHRTGDAAGKFQTRQAQRLRLAAQPPQRLPGPGGDAHRVRIKAGVFHPGQAAHVNDRAVKPGIVKQCVGAVAEQVDADTVFPAELQGAAQLLCIPGRRRLPGRRS